MLCQADSKHLCYSNFLISFAFLNLKTSRELGWVKKRRKASKYVSHFECINSRNFATMNSICEYTFTASYSSLLKQLILVATCVVHEQLVQLDLRSNFALFTWLDISRGDAGVGVQCVMSQ